ncbi:MAG: UDP-3-O-(3-hydroxymyristoyl)glucosamine N-acyltransferase [Planctomycetota bacterium]
MKKLAELATALSAKLEGEPQTPIKAARPLETAGDGELTYLEESRRPPPLESIRASAVIVHRDADSRAFPKHVALLRVESPRLAFAQALAILYPEEPRPFSGISQSAHIDATAELGSGVHIAPGVFVGPGVKISAGVVLYPGVTIVADCVLGEGVLIHSHVTLYPRCEIGQRTIIHAGAVIGSDGFGYVPTPTGAHKIPHRGRVVIAEDVEIGANTTIDRSVVDDTFIGRGTKIDNQVMIAHNCIIGPNCFIAAQTGMAGSSQLGSGVQLGGQVGLSGHITIGDGAMVAAKSGVHKDVPPGKEIFGYPAIDRRLADKVFAILSRLPELRSQIIQNTARLDKQSAKSSE